MRPRVPRAGDVWGNTGGVLVRVLSVDYRPGWGDVVFFRYVGARADDDTRDGADQIGLFMRDYWPKDAAIG